jgi:3-hydroxyisobutyrate dehydrogenase-like beta-hydroxyacid dehydrogenase
MGSDLSASRHGLLTIAVSSCLLVTRAGMGAKAKLASNLVLGLNRAVFAEGLAFAESLGIAPERFLAIVLQLRGRSA